MLRNRPVGNAPSGWEWDRLVFWETGPTPSPPRIFHSGAVTQISSNKALSWPPPAESGGKSIWGNEGNSRREDEGDLLALLKRQRDRDREKQNGEWREREREGERETETRKGRGRREEEREEDREERRGNREEYRVKSSGSSSITQL